MGGFHLFQEYDKTLAWTGEKLREAAGLTRRTCFVGAVGATFTLEGGLSPGRIAQ